MSTAPTSSISALHASDVQSRKWSRFAPVGLFLLLTLGLFFDPLFVHRDRVLGKPGTDLSAQFLPWRQFGFDELRAGNLPLWNPHIFGGAPFFAGFQSALLYPPNWLHLVLPLASAINWIIALHVFLAGWFTYLWCRQRGISRSGATVAGATFMLSGPYFMHIVAGHLPHVCAMVWAPLILWTIDGLLKRDAQVAIDESTDVDSDKPPVEPMTFFEPVEPAPEPAHAWDGGLHYVRERKRSAQRRFCPSRVVASRTRASGNSSPLSLLLVGIGAVAMQILAGHPQYVYYTAIAVGLYVSLQLPWLKARLRFAGFCIAIYVGGAMLSAVQLLPGIDFSRESWRGDGTPASFANAFSLPPENLLTLFAPGVLGDMNGSPYIGRWQLWETSAFIGAAGLALAITGLVAAAGRRQRISLIVLLATLTVLALGAYTPIHAVARTFLPGYSSFRGSAKFTFVIALFLAMLSGAGIDAVCLSARRRIRTSIYSVIAGISLAFFAGIVAAATLRSGAWRRVLSFIRSTGETCNLSLNFSDPALIRASGLAAAQSLLVGAVMLLLLALMLRRVSRRPRWSLALVILCVGELALFARGNVETQSTDLDYPQTWRAAVAASPADERTLHLEDFRANAGMTLGFNDISGYDAAAPGRYIRFIAATQKVPANEVTQNVQITKISTAFGLLRCGTIFPRDENGAITQLEHPMPRFSVIESANVASGAYDALSRVIDPAFDSSTTVVLETRPDITFQNPHFGLKGKVELVRETTDEIEFTASLDRPAVLVVSDMYARGWRVKSIGDQVAPQAEYRVIPADYLLRGVPLQAGQHHLLMEYAPASFASGKWISIGSLVAYLTSGALSLRRFGSTSALVGSDN